MRGLFCQVQHPGVYDSNLKTDVLLLVDVFETF